MPSSSKSTEKLKPKVIHAMPHAKKVKRVIIYDGKSTHEKSSLIADANAAMVSRVSLNPFKAGLQTVNREKVNLESRNYANILQSGSSCFPERMMHYSVCSCP